MILIDLQKAFDLISLDMLFRKLSIIGFSDGTGQRFKSYLSNRKISVNLENSFSKISSILCHVRPGSILGSLLFLVYSNDMPMALKCNLFLYADDTVKCNIFLYVDNTCLVFQSKNVKDWKSK